jgi:IclR family pca regulon transcriptional regulator
VATPKNNSVIRAFRILAAFDDRSPEMSAAEVAGKIGLNTATTHRFLLTLADVGAVARTAAGKFRLGMQLADLGSRVMRKTVLADAAGEVIRAVAAEVRETTHIAILVDNVVVAIAQAEPDRNLRIDTQVGRHLPAYCTGHGKTLLAALDDRALAAYFAATKLERKTPTTLTTERELRAELDRIRVRGHSVGDEETEIGLRSISVPIRDVQGVVRAAIAVSGPSSRMTDAYIKSILPRLKTAAADITHALYPLDAA